jgi:uncharacterized protein (TIGR02453 family)
MAFFTEETLEFWRGLARNNSKTWFDAHRSDYETHLKEPYHRLAVALVDRVRKGQPEYLVDPKKAVYRINRDVRFSKDKSPYKTELGITIGRSQKHDGEWPTYTTRLGINGLAIAGGMYAPPTDLRDGLRRYVGEHSAELRELQAESSFTDVFGELVGEAHKRPLPDLKDAAESEPLVLNTQWVFWTNFEDPEIILDDQIDEIIFDHWDVARPIAEFFKEAIVSLSD